MGWGEPIQPVHPARRTGRALRLADRLDEIAEEGVSDYCRELGDDHVLRHAAELIRELVS